MGTVETVLATVVTVLAAVAVVGALVFAVVWEACAIRRTLAAHRDAAGRPPTDEDFWCQQRALHEPQ
jgi:HAMP domain-containing protein